MLKSLNLPYSCPEMTSDTKHDFLKAKKKAKTIALRTLTACDGFTIAMINIFIGAFVV